MTDYQSETARQATPGDQTGYKRPPVQHQFKKGHSGNRFGRPKEARNLITVLSNVLKQPVTFKQGGKTHQIAKGDAVIKVLMNMGTKGERRATDAVITLISKIERLVDKPEAERKGVGVMVVPGVAKSSEEWLKYMAAYKKKAAEKDEQQKADAPRLKREEAALRDTIALHKGTPLADNAVARLEELTHSIEYLSNPYTLQSLKSLVPPEDAVAGVPKERVAKLPWDQQEFIQMPFFKRDEYIRTHSESSEV
jgi:hypothetical protein